MGINGNTLFKASILEAEEAYASNALELEITTISDADSTSIIRIYGVTPSQVRSMIEVLTNTLPHIQKQYKEQR